MAGLRLLVRVAGTQPGAVAGTFSYGGRLFLNCLLLSQERQASTDAKTLCKYVDLTRSARGRFGDRF